METPIKTYRNGKRVLDVYTDRKVRSGYFGNDQWSVLHRNTVPNLTDAEWYAAPNDEWTLQG